LVFARPSVTADKGSSCAPFDLREEAKEMRIEKHGVDGLSMGLLRGSIGEAVPVFAIFRPGQLRAFKRMD
jgi:hypothetical protein